MASIYNFKPQFQCLLRPVMLWLRRAGITPNAITILALTGSCCAGSALWLMRGQTIWLLLLPVWLFARMALNALDGMMARECNLATPRGAVLNELGDVLSDLALYLPLAAWNREAALPVFAFTLGAVLTEFCGLLGCALGTARRYDGPMGKSDRAGLIGMMNLLTGLWPMAIAAWSSVFAVASVLTVVTCWNRVVHAIGKSQIIDTDWRSQ